MTDKIAILGLVITALGSIAVPLALALIQRDSDPASGGQVGTAGTIAPSTSGARTTTDTGATEPSASAEATPAQLDGTTLELPEGYYADLDSGKVDNDELFRREADIGLRSLDLTAASSWEYRSKVQMALLDEGAGREACGKETQFTRSVSDRDLRVGMQICVRSTRGKMFLLRVEEIPTYSTQPSVLVVQVA